MSLDNDMIVPNPPVEKIRRYKRDHDEFEAEEEMKLIREFDFEGVPEHPVFMLCAKRGSGKTFVLKHIVRYLHSKYDYDEVYLWSLTADLQIKVDDDPFFFIPKEHVFNEFDEEHVKRIIEFNEELKKKDNLLPKNQRRNRNILLIFDDMIEDRNVVKSKILTSLCTRGRHSNVSLILLTQVLSSLGGFNTTMRKNIDCFVGFDNYDESTREMAGDAFVSKFNPKVGKLLLTKIPMLEPFMSTFILFRNANPEFQAKRYSDYVFKYKAPKEELKKFVIGNKPNGLIYFIEPPEKKNKIKNKNILTNVNLKFKLL